MNFASRTIRFLLPFAVAALAAGQTQAPQDKSDLSQRDLQPRPLPGTPGTATAPPVPRGYALVVGISKYEKLDVVELKFPESDAEAVYRVLISQRGGAFPPENVKKLIGPQATLRNLKSALEEWLPSVAKESDRVVVYFAGHGAVSNTTGRGYLAPWDVDLEILERTSYPERTAYPMDRLGEVLGKRVKAHWKVLLADTCHSGKITPNTTNEAINAELSKLPRDFLTLRAARERESSYEDENLQNGFGVFSYYVVKALEGEADDDPCDGVITAEEFIEYVRREVSEYAKKRGTEQTPNEQGDFDNNMVLGINPDYADSGCKDARRRFVSGTLVVEANMDDVEVYVDDSRQGTVSKSKPLRLPGLKTGLHTVKGFRKGYEPDTQEVAVEPGRENPVTLRIQYRPEHKPKAIGFVDDGEKLLYKRNSAWNPADVYPSGQQTAKDLKKARELFEKALKEDPKYAKAAFDLAQTCQLLSDYKAMLEAFRRAVQTDPTYVEVRVAYAGSLIEEGDPDEAIRQLTEATLLEPDNDVAHSHLARAYLDKEVWDRAIESAEKATSLNASNYEPYLWKADALRRETAGERNESRRLNTYAQSVESYRKYLALTNFSTPAGEKLVFYFVGFGLGRRSHADRQLPYVYQRNLAFMGLCDCEDKLGNFLRASDYCQRAIKYDPEEAMAYFFLGNVYRDLYNRALSRDYLVLARKNYSKMIQINPDLEMSGHAKDYIEQIDQLLHKQISTYFPSPDWHGSRKALT